MKLINCLIVDDEPIARDIIKSYCDHFPYLQIVASCGNALEAKLVLQRQQVDILFLDINMPVMDGIEFLKTLKHAPQVIFTTAYREYALDAFELAACDYLLKPFSLQRFVMALDRAMERLDKPLIPDAAEEQKREDDYLFIKTEGKIFKVSYDELLYGEANGNYTKINTRDAVLLPKMVFSTFEELLPRPLFLRVHRSFIINKSKISHIEGNRVFIGKTEIPIGSNYREEFLKVLGL
ncbi:LytR/AlgR family response regulator transcription factor [Pedobacter sp. PWIIR3]